MNPWYATPTLSGSLVWLEPLALAHAPGYLAAAGTDPADDEVFRWQSPAGSTLHRPDRTSPPTGRSGRGGAR